MDGDTRIVLNARIVASPRALRETFASVLRSASEAAGARMESYEEACFTPKAQAPKHLMKA